MNMKKNIIFSVLTILAVLGFASCSSDSDKEPVASPDEVLTHIRISAVYGGNDNTTRAAYTEDGNSITATWESGDELYVCYNGHKNILNLTDGAGTANATFEGTIQGKPFNNSILICYVHDKNHPADITFNDNGEYYYADDTFTTQDGTLEGATKRNVYFGATTYATGENITCEFFVNTSMMKFMVTAPDEVSAGDAATLKKDFANKTSLSNTHIFNYLFDGNTALTDASELLLPVTTLTQACYAYMFRNCTTLTAAPTLPATTLAKVCYQYMFQGCTSLTTAPDLLAPALPILDALDCYASMFKGCTNLNYVKCLATSGSFKYASNWLSGVAATGTFYKAKGVSWNRDGSGIPTGWTVEEVE